MAAVEAALAGEEKLLACISVRPERVSEGDAKPEDLYDVGTLVQIKRMERVEDTLHLIVQGIDRIQLEAWEQTEPHLRARVRVLPELELRDKEKVEKSQPCGRDPIEQTHKEVGIAKRKQAGGDKAD